MTRIWLIAGPTASGKSALALRLAERSRGEIVNADSMQLYRDLRVLTARPSSEEEARAPHHLFGVADAADGWSAGRWLRAAVEILDDIAARGRTAIVVGGTGLYFRALTQGLDDIPPAPDAVRRRAGEDFASLGEAAFRARLALHDPAAAARISTGDRQRLVRAWAVWSATGRPLSDWQGAAKPAIDAYAAVALDPPREVLYARCDARLADMAQAGALDEVAALVARDLDPTLPLMKAVGVREFASHLRGEATLPEALDAARRETRRYAKRQLTWLRNQAQAWPRIHTPDPQEQWEALSRLSPAPVAS